MRNADSSRPTSVEQRLLRYLPVSLLFPHLFLFSLASRCSVTARIIQLLVPIRPPCGSEIEEIPERLDRSHMPRVLAGIGWRKQQFGAPEMPDPSVAAALEHAQHRHLLALGVLAPVVTLEAIARGRQH